VSKEDLAYPTTMNFCTNQIKIGFDDVAIVFDIFAVAKSKEDLT